MGFHNHDVGWIPSLLCNLVVSLSSLFQFVLKVMKFQFSDLDLEINLCDGFDGLGGLALFFIVVGSGYYLEYLVYFALGLSHRGLGRLHLCLQYVCK